jgi:hypothetical protein
MLDTQVHVRFFTLLLLLSLGACGGGGSSLPLAAAAPVVTNTNTDVPDVPNVPAEPVEPAGVAYIMDEFFPGKTFSGMRDLARPAVTANPLGSAMLGCTVLMTEASLCSFNQLPLLGMQTIDPSIDDIMARTLVSHEWMAVRLREVLERMPPELLLIMRGITAIVISYDVRPSFYWQGTGAIYLDPDRLWLTEAERLTVDPAPDYRTDLGNVFQFLMPARYVAAGEVDLRNLTRSLDTVALRMAALFYHELAHANDFYPPASLPTINRTVPMYQAVLTGSRPSNLLQGSFPLSSMLMARLAGVSFSGNTARTADRELLAADVGAEFPLDVANDFYNYSSPREDLAMLFEEAMMFYSFGIGRDVAVTNLPAELLSCDQLLVAWGERHRVAHPAILARVQLVLDKVLPEVASAVEQRLASLVPMPMRAGEDFCANIALNMTAPEAPQQPSSTRGAPRVGASSNLLPGKFLPYL